MYVPKANVAIPINKLLLAIKANPPSIKLDPIIFLIIITSVVIFILL